MIITIILIIILTILIVPPEDHLVHSAGAWSATAGAAPYGVNTIPISGGRLCTLIGLPWRGVSFSTLSTGRFVLKQYICKGAESAEHAETAGYTYEGTPTTA